MVSERVSKRTSIKIQLVLVLVGVLLFVGILGAVSGPLSVALRESGVWQVPISLGMLSGIASVIIAIFFIVWFANRLINPLEKLSRVAARISAGELSARAQITSRNEIGVLSTTFNQMADQLEAKIKSLEEAIKLKDEFISISAHNLKNPLVVMEGHLERLLSERHPPQEQAAHSLLELSNQVLHLQQITSKLLIAAEAQGKMFSMEPQPNDWVRVAQEVIDEFKPIAEKKKIRLSAKFSAHEIQSVFDKKYLTEVWENLIDNAIKFTPTGGRVMVRVTERKNLVLGEVRDTGIGIPPDELKKVFLPFHRVQNVLDADYSGIGLGLYVVKLILAEQGGKIKVQSEPGRGTRVRFMLPK